MATPPVFSPGAILLADQMNDIGLWLVKSRSFSAVAFVTDDDVFTSDFKNYRIMVNIDSLSGSNVQLRGQFRAGGVTETANYAHARIFMNTATTVAADQNPVATSQFLVAGGNVTTFLTTAAIDVFNPQGAGITGFEVQSQNRPTTFVSVQINAGQQNSATQFDGFLLGISSGTITGTINYYGYRN